MRADQRPKPQPTDGDLTGKIVPATWPPAFGERSAPNLWVPHCTLATRVPKPELREVQAAIAERFEPIRGTVDALATILVGGRGDVAHHRLAGAH